MSKPPTKPALVEFVQIDYKKHAKALVVNFVVSNVDRVKDLSRVELLISNADDEAVFAVMLNYGDRLDPIPPGGFGVIINPSSDDRSIKNVSDAAGIPARWDHDASNATLLKESSRGVINGNLGISLWIAPKDWAPGHYSIKTRSVSWKHLPAPWEKLTEFDYTGSGIRKVIQTACLIKPIIINAAHQKAMSFDDIGSIILIHYEKQPQEKGVIMKRWAGDRSGEYKYVEIETRELESVDLQSGLISLKPGTYKFKHNSVSGMSGMTSGYYGESRLFEIKAKDDIIEVEILLYMAI